MAAVRSMTIGQWATELGCAQETLRKAIRRKQLLATRQPLRRGRPFLINSHDMAAFLDKRRFE